MIVRHNLHFVFSFISSRQPSWINPSLFKDLLQTSSIQHSLSYAFLCIAMLAYSL